MFYLFLKIWKSLFGGGGLTNFPQSFGRVTLAQFIIQPSKASKQLSDFCVDKMVTESYYSTSTKQTWHDNWISEAALTELIYLKVTCVCFFPENVRLMSTVLSFS